MPSCFGRLAELQSFIPQFLRRYLILRCNGIQDIIRQGNLFQFTGLAFEVVELLAVCLPGPGFLQVEVHVDGGARPILRRGYEISGCADQRTGQRAQYPELPRLEQADQVIEGRRGEDPRHFISFCHRVTGTQRLLICLDQFPSPPV